MATTLSGSVAGGIVTVTGTGYTPGQTIRLAVTFASTDGKRRYVEAFAAVVDGSGNIAFSVPIVQTGGSITVRSLVLGTTAVLGTSTPQAV